MTSVRTPALALAAILAASDFASAQEGGAAKSRPDDGFTMTLGGTGTAAQAASADDTELTCWCHRRCYYGGGYGYGGGYSSYYGGGYGYGGYGYGGWGGSYVSYGYAAPYYRPFYRPLYNAIAYRPYFYPRVTPYAGYGRGYRYIGADADDLDAPVVPLNSSAAKAPAVTSPAALPEGGFRYDGGPANPVPLPKPGATGARNADATSLPVALPKAKPAGPYTYKAYGEK